MTRPKAVFISVTVAQIGPQCVWGLSSRNQLSNCTHLGFLVTSYWFLFYCINTSTVLIEWDDHLVCRSVSTFFWGGGGRLRGMLGKGEGGLKRHVSDLTASLSSIESNHWQHKLTVSVIGCIARFIDIRPCMGTLGSGNV